MSWKKWVWGTEGKVLTPQFVGVLIAVVLIGIAIMAANGAFDSITDW